MRVLFSTCSPAGYMAPPILGDEQINCGPDWPDEKEAGGRWRSLRTPVGDYDLATISAKLPSEQRPDLVVCLVDASWRNTPRGLAAFKCPRILLVADTHHLRQPLIGMLRYATSEPFTRIVLLYDRHHATIFRSAGIRNLFWFPGLTFPHSDAIVRAARKPSTERASHIAFVGQMGQIHCRRARMLEALATSEFAVNRQQKSQVASLEFYGNSLVGFNSSLNGDLNLRVFEVLSSGAALLTDRLARDSGLVDLFVEGRQLLAYGSAEELTERAADALGNKDITQAIGAEGARWFDEHFSQRRRKEMFLRLATDGIADEKFAFSGAEQTRVLFSGATDRLVRSTAIYEKVQEMHRTREQVTVALSAGLSVDVAELFTTLPRVRCVPDAAAKVDLIATTTGEDSLQARSTRVWYADGGGERFEAVREQMEAQGAVCVEPKIAFFRLKAPSREADARKHLLVYTDDPESGGVAQYNHTLLLALVGAGYRVSSVQSRADNPLIAAQREAGVIHHWIEYHTGRDFARTLADTDPAEDIFCEDPADLVIFSDCCPISNLAAREMARRLEAPYIVVVGFVGEYLAKNFAQYLPALATQYASARAVIAVSENNRELLVRIFGAPADRCEVIHYGRPEHFFQPQDPVVRSRLRAELKIPADAVVCLTTARLTAVKGFKYQLSALKRLRGTPAAKRLHFVWAGDGDQRAELEREIAALGLGGRVHLLGHRWDVAEWYDAADIFVLPSQVEGMPLSIMEAMAKALPVIASAVSGIPEELGDTGVLLTDPTADSDATVGNLARALCELSGSVETRMTMGLRGKRRAEEHFTLGKMCALTLELCARTMAPTLCVS